jgi:hypothetical protein
VNNCVRGDPVIDPFPQISEFMLAKTRAWSCRLSSFMLRLSESVILSTSFVKEILDAHAKTLRSITLISCGLHNSSLESVARRCILLERLAVKIPAKDVVSFIGTSLLDLSIKLVYHFSRIYLRNPYQVATPFVSCMILQKHMPFTARSSSATTMLRTLYTQCRLLPQ